MITKDDDKGDDKKLKHQSKNNSSESKINLRTTQVNQDQSQNNSSESRTIQEFKIRIKKNSRLKKKAQNQESRFKVQDLKNQDQDSRFKHEENTQSR